MCLMFDFEQVNVSWVCSQFLKMFPSPISEGEQNDIFNSNSSSHRHVFITFD